MSTLGDPLTDIGMMFVYWPQAGEDRASTQSALTTLPGFPTRLEAAERYAQRTGVDLADLNWYVGFAFFKFAAIIAGIVARSAAGAMAGKNTSGYAERIDPVRGAGTRRARGRCDLAGRSGSKLRPTRVLART